MSLRYNAAQNSWEGVHFSRDDAPSSDARLQDSVAHIHSAIESRRRLDDHDGVNQAQLSEFGRAALGDPIVLPAYRR